MEVTPKDKMDVQLEGRLAYGLPRAARLLDVSKSFLALEAARGRLQVRRLGRRVVVTVDELRRYLDGASPRDAA